MDVPCATALLSPHPVLLRFASDCPSSSPGSLPLTVDVGELLNAVSAPSPASITLPPFCAGAPRAPRRAAQ